MTLLLAIPALSTASDGNDEQWRNVATSELVVIELDEGQVIVELNPDFAPLTVAQFKRLVRTGFYDGQDFYRVIDGFVAQGGDGSDMGDANDEPALPAEFERAWSDDLRYTQVQSPDLFAPETGLVDGFAVGRDMQAGKIWLAHCPGVVAMARGNKPGSSSTDFYFVIGQAPRHLDRNMSVFGRVVHGMDVVQRIRRGESGKNGMIDDPAMRSTIRTIRIVEDIDSVSQLEVQVTNTWSADFQEMLQQRRDRRSDFFHSKPPLSLDVCQVPNSGRRLDQDTIAGSEVFTLSEADYAAADKLDHTNLASLVKNSAVKPHWLDGGKQFWYTRDEDEGRSVILVDIASGKRETALVCGADEPVCRLGDDPVVDHQLLMAPGQDLAVFVRDHDLWLRNLADGSESALTTDGERYAAYASATDQGLFSRRNTDPDAISRPSETHWSPNGRWLTTRWLDERDVEPYPFLESVPTDGSFRPRVKEARVVLLGDENGYKIKDYIVDVKTKSRIGIQLPEGLDLNDPAVGNVPLGWSEDGQECYLYVSSADAKLGSLIAVDMRTGKSRAVFRENAPNSRVYLAPLGSSAMVRILGDEFIWYSERSNYGHLYLYDLGTGKLKRQLTNGNAAVSSILHVDAEHRSILISKSRANEGLDPYQQYIYRVDLDSGESSLLTPETGHHDVDATKVSPDGAYFVDSISTISTPPRMQLRSVWEPGVEVDLEEANPSALFELGWRPPQRARVKAADGETDLYAVLYRAGGRFESRGSLPVIDLNYINSIVSIAPVGFMEAVGMPWAIGVTQLGMHVVVVDGRGTPGRSRDFREAGYPAFADIQIDDHVAAIRELAERFPEIDSKRVGIWGSSNGGAGAARAILNQPGFFKVAVAAAGSHDYTSLPPSGMKFFGAPEYSDGTAVRPTPDAVPKNYLPFDNAALAANLAGHLLLAYGDMDNLALPTTTHRLANALIEADKTFDLLHMPNRGHLLLYEPYFKRRLRNYFVEHLHDIEPPM